MAPITHHPSPFHPFTMRPAIERALADAGISDPITSVRDLSGGCIHRVSELTLADGRKLVAKTNEASLREVFREEAAGLAALAATETVLVPQPLAVTVAGAEAVLLMTAIPPGPATDAGWRRFGCELAALHQTRPDRGRAYGFDADNHIGSTPQPNAWCDDWVEFNAEHRLGYQVDLAERRRALAGREVKRLRQAIARLDELIPRRPAPGLLHGDLWSGNALPAAGERIAVIDPACSYGDGWADIAMMQLFGGFPSACVEAYAGEVDDHDDLETRIAVYQLYHLLNHVNLFGGGYLGQAMAIVRSLGS